MHKSHSRLIIWSLVGLLMVSCQEDERRRLFEMLFVPIAFTVPAGLFNGPVPRVFSEPVVATNINFYLEENNLEAEQIGNINALAADIRSLEPGLNYNFLNEVSVRICPVGSNQCTPADEVFYIDRLQLDRPGGQIRLLPTLANKRDLLLEPAFRLEIWFFLADISPYSINSQLEMSFEVTE